jgi:hypothetical protein
MTWNAAYRQIAMVSNKPVRLPTLGTSGEHQRPDTRESRTSRRSPIMSVLSMTTS